jgi:putative transposase
MKKIKYTEEQIVGILKEVEAGITVSEICRKYGISDATYYNWKSKYGGMAASDIKRLRQLEDENRRLKHLVADLTLDNQALKAVISKNF